MLHAIVHWNNRIKLKGMEGFNMLLKKIYYDKEKENAK